MPAPRPDGQAVAPAQGSRDKNKGTRSPNPAEADTLLAQILMAAQRTAQLPYDQDYLSQLDKPKFDPSEFLAAKQGLDAAYTAAEGKTQDTSAMPSYAGVVGGGRGAAAYAASRKTLPATSSEDPGVIDAQRAYDDQLRIRRADALNVDPTRTAEPVKIKEEVNKLSWDEYNNLTPLQRAAVDYNTMLVKAVKRDRRMQDQYDPNDEQMATYTNTVERMFGDKGGLSATTYAPETVALLNQLGYQGDKAGNLDDFVNLDAALQTKDLKRLDKAEDLGLRRGGAGSPFSNPVMKERMDFLGGMVSATENAQAAALEKGNKLLAQFSQASFSQLRGDDVERLGGFDVAETGRGFGDSTQDATFQQLFDYFADKSQDSETMLYALQSDWSEKERKAFMSYAQKRLLTAAQANVAPTESQLVEPRTAEEIAQVLQLSGFSKGGVSNG